MTSLISRSYNFPIHGGKIEMVRGSSIGGVHPCTKECDNKIKKKLTSIWGEYVCDNGFKLFFMKKSKITSLR